jgi:hypothetical protein
MKKKGVIEALSDDITGFSTVFTLNNGMVYLNNDGLYFKIYKNRKDYLDGNALKEVLSEEELDEFLDEYTDENGYVKKEK